MPPNNMLEHREPSGKPFRSSLPASSLHKIGLVQHRTALVDGLLPKMRGKTVKMSGNLVKMRGKTVKMRGNLVKL